MTDHPLHYLLIYDLNAKNNKGTIMIHERKLAEVAKIYKKYRHSKIRSNWQLFRVKYMDLKTLLKKEED